MLRREDGHVLRGVLHFEVDGQRKKRRPKRTWKRHVREESVKVGLRREDALCRSKWSVGVNQIYTKIVVFLLSKENLCATFYKIVVRVKIVSLNQVFLCHVSVMEIIGLPHVDVNLTTTSFWWCCRTYDSGVCLCVPDCSASFHTTDYCILVKKVICWHGISGTVTS